MDAETYLKERVEDQIAWYDRRASFNKRWFISLRAVEITAAATVPFLSGFAAEALKKEKFLFTTKTEPYDSDEAFPILVQRMETLVSKENVTWAQYLMKPDKEKAKASA